MVLLERLVGTEVKLINEIERSGTALNQQSDCVAAFINQLNDIRGKILR
jgi:hypothetical protein